MREVAAFVHVLDKVPIVIDRDGNLRRLADRDRSRGRVVALALLANTIIDVDKDADEQVTGRGKRGRRRPNVDVKITASNRHGTRTAFLGHQEIARWRLMVGIYARDLRSIAQTNKVLQRQF